MMLAACSQATRPASPPDLAAIEQTTRPAALPSLVPSVTSTIPPVDTATPAATPTPSATLAPADTSTPSATPRPSPTPVRLSGVPLEHILVLPEAARQHIQQIADRGRALGRDANAFARVGGSVAATIHFMGRFDTGPYDLGPYADLQSTIDYFAGSFGRVGQAAKRGLTANGTLDPVWSDPEFCLPNEAPVDCEIRLQNPSVIIVVLGTNDIGNGQKFEEDLHDLLAHIVEQGIVPVLATKSDRFEGSDNRNNTIIRQMAADLQLPLWDFDRIAGTIPGRGMGADNVHLTLYDQYDYTDETAFERGYGVYNLTALMMLDAVRQVIAP